MKKGLVVFLNLALLSLLCMPAFSQPSSRSVETFVMDNFDKEDGHEWTWTVNASRFIAEGYPKSGYFNGIPESLKPLRKAEDGEPKVFGVKTAFNRKGDNWFEIYPVKDSKPYEIPFIGTVTQLDFWVWGANYMYYLEVMVRDVDGRVHVLPVTNLAFNGWRNVVVNIPGWLNQHSKLRSGRSAMTFVGFRVRTDPEEFVDDFMIYFDQLKYTTNSLAEMFDGYELKDTDFGNTGTQTTNQTSTQTSSQNSSTNAEGK
ncbi:MAG: flagellar filament outer layer protein FlaA [Treponema sp.]